MEPWQLLGAGYAAARPQAAPVHAAIQRSGMVGTMAVLIEAEVGGTPGFMVWQRCVVFLCSALRWHAAGLLAWGFITVVNDHSPVQLTGMSAGNEAHTEPDSGMQCAQGHEVTSSAASRTIQVQRMPSQPLAHPVEALSAFTQRSARSLWCAHARITQSCFQATPRLQLLSTHGSAVLAVVHT